MSAVPAESKNRLLDTLSICRTSITTTWKLGLAGAILVAMLSLSVGASPSASVIRGGVCLLVFGLIGWGINALLLTAGEKAAIELETQDEEEPATASEEDALS